MCRSSRPSRDTAKRRCCRSPSGRRRRPRLNSAETSAARAASAASAGSWRSPDIPAAACGTSACGSAARGRGVSTRTDSRRARVEDQRPLAEDDARRRSRASPPCRCPSTLCSPLQRARHDHVGGMQQLALVVEQQLLRQRAAFGREGDQLQMLVGESREERDVAEHIDVGVERLAAPCLSRQLVAAGLGDQQLGMRRIALDLLPQAVDVGFERVRGHAGIVAPHLGEKHVARDDPVARPVEIFQDRRLLLGQPDLSAGRRRAAFSPPAGTCSGRSRRSRPRSARAGEDARGCGRAAPRSGTA